MVLQIIWILLGILGLGGALALMLWPRWVAAVPAYLGMVCWHLSYYIMVPGRTFLFWGIATLLVTGLYYLSPQGEPDGRRTGNLYIAATAIAGGLLGILFSPRYMVLGVVIGALMGELAYSRTPHGKWLMGSAGTFFNYAAVKCLPVIVAVSIVCITIEGFVF